MALSQSDIMSIIRLCISEPYTISQLARRLLVRHPEKGYKKQYRETYDFFRTQKAKSLFYIHWKPQIAKTAFSGNILVRTAPKGLDLITAGANLKPRFAGAQEAQNRQQARRQEKQAEKEVFRKLNYPQVVLNALQAGDLEPSDLPARGHPGSSKYRELIPDRKERAEVDPLFQDLWPQDPDEEADEADILPDPPAEDLPHGWTREGRLYRETVPTAAAGAFGADGLPEEGEPLDLPFSFDLMLQEFEQDMRKKYEPFKLGKCGPERFEAVMKMIRAHVKNFGYTVAEKNEKGKRKFIPRNQELFEECVELFEQYLGRTTDERLVLLPKKDPWGEPVLLPNANRFNNEEKRAKSRITFENIFNDAGRKWKSAVMLTLTSGQWHDNIFDDVKLFQENWNKLITRLRKEAKDSRVRDLIRRNPEFLKVRVQKNLIEMPGGGEMAAYEYSSDILTPHSEKSLETFLEAAESFQIRTRTKRRHEGLQGRDESDAAYFERIRGQQRAHNATAQDLRQAAREYVKCDQNLKMPYLCVREFQRNGNIHYHVIIFGISWLKPNDEISKIWQQYGQGKITKINKIRWNDGRGYMWSGNAPEDSAGRQPLEYLKKYLLKGQYADRNPEAALLYWIFNTRFYTFSQSLLSDEHRPRPYVSKGLYEYAGVLSADNVMFSMGCLVLDGGSPPLGSLSESPMGTACT